MEMLNGMGMLLKSDLWTIIIDGFSKWIINYGWMIVVFTIILKLVMSPLDILQRRANQKQSRFMALMQPEMDQIKKKYGDDPKRVNEEQAKLYKKYNVNMGGMCFSMLITMVVSFVVFLTLFGSLKAYGNDKLNSTYHQLDVRYQQAEVYANENYSTPEDIDAYISAEIKKEYENIQKKNSWLWVKNVWKGDKKTSQFVDFNTYANYYGIKDTETDPARTEAKARYQVITQTLTENQKDQNGYYGLIILAVVVSFLTQFLSAKLLTPKGQKLSGMNMIMFIVIPISMALFAWNSNVVFTLYIITNSIMSTIISTILSLIMNRKNKNGDVITPKKKVEVVEYSRNYKK